MPTMATPARAARPLLAWLAGSLAWLAVAGSLPVAGNAAAADVPAHAGVAAASDPAVRIAAVGAGKGVLASTRVAADAHGGSSVVWRSSAGDRDYGQVLGKPLRIVLTTGEAGVVVGNGINSDNGKAVMFVHDIGDGTVLAKLDTGAGSASQRNGLLSVRGWDFDGDGSVDFIYAGDLLGNLWKFDLSDRRPEQWHVANRGQPLFVASDADGKRQPITGGLSLALDPIDFSTWVFFGTGRLLSADDRATTDTQSLYGLIDAGVAITGRSALMQRKIVSLGINSGKIVRGFEPAGERAAEKSGWYIDLLAPPGGLAEGERIVGTVAVIGRVLLSTSSIAGDERKQAGGRGFVNALDAFTGASVDTALFDVNGNGVFSDDTIAGSAIGSVDLGVGIPGVPTLIAGQLLVHGSLGRVARIAIINPATVGRISWREVIAD